MRDRLRRFLIPVLFGLMSAGSGAGAQDVVVVATSDFSSGSLASLKAGSDTASVNLINTHSDNAIRSYNGTVYVVNRLGADNILVLDPKDLKKAVRQFTVGKGANPQDIAWISATKAYVTRYERTTLLVVNPSTGDSLKSISLSAFADSDGLPEMAGVLVSGKRAYVVCQRLDRKAQFPVPSDKSTVAVIDTDADAVVDLDPAAAGTQGIDLTLKNPVGAAMQGTKLVLSCVGSYGDYRDGGIEVVDTAANRSLGTAIGEAALGGNVGPVAMASDSVGYVAVSDASFTNSLRRFNVATRAASDALKGHSGGYTPDLLCSGGKLYVADQGSFTNPKSAGLLIYDAVTGEKLKGPISTGLPPNALAIVTAAAAASPAMTLDLDPASGDQRLRTRSGVASGQKIDIELYALEQALGAVGFSARIEFDSTAVSYVNGSFKPGTMFSGTFLPLANGKSSYVEVGGSTLGGGSATTDSGRLGTLQLEIKSGFAAETQVTLTTASYNRGGGRQDRYTPQTSLKLSAAGGLTADFDGNGVVDFDDFFAFAAAFGQPGTGANAPFDLNRSGQVDFDDFFVFAEQFGKRRS